MRVRHRPTSDEVTSAIDRDGHVVEHAVYDTAAIERLQREAQRLVQGDALAGKRNLLTLSAAIAKISIGPEMRPLLEPVLGPKFFPVRAILFDKTPEKNWTVLWHQDLTIAVQGKVETEGFGPWSEKDGVPHVQPPESVLRNMLTARVHLDPADETNGALRVVPGSHTKGIVSRADIETLTANGHAVTCSARPGDVLLMRPLLLHSSQRAKTPTHRRVIHIEYSNRELPLPLRWHDPPRGFQLGARN